MLGGTVGGAHYDMYCPNANKGAVLSLSTVRAAVETRIFRSSLGGMLRRAIPPYPAVLFRLFRRPRLLRVRPRSDGLADTGGGRTPGVRTGCGPKADSRYEATPSQSVYVGCVIRCHPLLFGSGTGNTHWWTGEQIDVAGTAPWPAASGRPADFFTKRQLGGRSRHALRVFPNHGPFGG